MTNEALIKEQLAREEDHRASAMAMSLTRLADATEKGAVDAVPAARVVIKRTFEPLRNEIRRMLEDKNSRAPDLHWYRRIGADAVTALLLRMLCKNCMRGDRTTIQQLCVPLGRAIMQEAHVRDAFYVNGLYMQRAEEYLRAKNVRSEAHSAKTMLAAAAKVLHEDFRPPANEALQVGKWALDCALRLGLAVQYREWSAQTQTLVLYGLAPELEEALLKTAYMDYLAGTAMLMLAPPVPWRPGQAGGYLLEHTNRLARKHGHKDRVQAREGLEQSRALMSCLNSMQSTPLCLEQRAVSLVRSVWVDQQGGSLGIPSIHGPAAPRWPFPDGWSKAQASEGELETFREWCHAKADWHTDEIRRKADVRRVGTLLREGTTLGERPVYAPTFADWRGRVYYQGTPNPQGEDYHKACLRFHEKKPLGERGLFWLKVHIANCFGYDKTRMADRAAWTDQHLPDLQSGMYRPQDSDVYREQADSPIMAALAVQELTSALDSHDPYDYPSGLPIHMDATCSGLQHFSALLRDQEGGAWVNLIDNGGAKKSDIYMRVLELLTMCLTDDLRTPNRILAESWLEAGLDRDYTKKPTMTYVYGCTPRSVSVHSRKYLLGKGWEQPGLSVFKMGDYIASRVLGALDGAVPAAAECLRWLRRAAEATPAETPFRWDTPIGTRVHQTYRDCRKARVKVRLCGVTNAIVLEDIDRMRVSKMMAGSAPNFVHSLDGAHLVRTVNRMVESGASMLGIHDSFGCHAADVDLMHRVIREEFVAMYEEHDPLESVRELNGIEAPAPLRGALDLRKVLQSEWFFS